MQRFEFSDGKSNKFWEIEQADTELNIRWGRIGTAGQSQTKGFGDAVKAKAALDKLVKEKTGKGYAEVGVDAAARIGKAPEKAAAPAQTAVPEKAAAAIQAAASESTAVPESAVAPTAAEEPAPEKPATSAPGEDVPETLGSQIERVVAAVCRAIAKDEIKARESVTETQLKRQYQVSERGAKLAHDRLRALGIFHWYGNQIADEAKEIAARAESQNHVDAPPADAAPAGSLDPDAPPWLAAGAPIRMTPRMRQAAYASRRFPQKVPAARDVDAAWREVYRLHMQTSGESRFVDRRFDVTQSDAAFQPALARMIERSRPETPPPDREADALLLALITHYENQGGAVAHYLVAQYGLPGAIDVFLEAEKNVELGWSSQANSHKVSAAVERTLYPRYPLAESGETLRQYLAAAPEAEWRACADQLEATLPRLIPRRRPGVALLLPDRPDVCNRLALELKDEAEAHWLLAAATDPEAIARLFKARPNSYYTLWRVPAHVATLVQERGLDAIPILERGAAEDEAGEALTAIGTPEAVAALAKAASGSKNALARAALAVERWPQAAIAALSRLIADKSKDAGQLTPMLLRLLRGHAGEVDGLRPWLGTAQQEVIDRLLQRLSGPDEVAAADELPSVLANPPWRAAKQKKAAAALSIAPLPLPAAENWDEAARREALSISYQWQQKHIDAAKKSLDALVYHLFPGDEKEHLPQKKAAMAAIRKGDAEALIAARNEVSVYASMYGSYVPLLPRDLAVAFWNAIAADGKSTVYDLDHLMANLGVDALPGLIAEMRRNPAQAMPVALNYGAVELAELMARAFARMKTLREQGRAWLLKYPEHAACGLIAPAVGKAGEAREAAAVSLRLLAAEGHGKLLADAAVRYGNAEVAAALDAVLNEKPLDLYPAKRQKLPEFWQPRDWPRPVLVNGKALPDAALDALGEMMTFPALESVYAGIGEVQAACRPETLAEFAWECFNAWLEVGAPGKENWALAALGLFGNDDTARKLTPLIRAWPGEAAHARAVAGLSVLETIGTDMALMLLNGIAQKLKFKGLQDKAREKIAAIAEKRGLTPEELEDRLAPDLGLDEQGTLILDFGPRRFKVGFDEALKPYVREMDGDVAGARLADLPKPKKTDDAGLGAAAVERFKLLKKDARTIASQQVTRLEVAMCARRRWTPDVFAAFLAGHPLVRHLVQRLIWGVFAVEGGDNYGGRLLSCFRVAEDGGYTTAEDDPFELPAGENIRVGMPHALEISAADAAAFGQLFADYELLQPFAQIGRDTYTLTAEEKQATQLVRWKGAKVPTGRVLGLVNKAWRRGQAQDGGGIWYFTKPLGDGRVIELYLDPGIIVGMVDEYPEQELGEVKYGQPAAWGEIKAERKFAELDDVAASELIRDMEALRQ